MIECSRVLEASRNSRCTYDPCAANNIRRGHSTFSDVFHYKDKHTSEIDKQFPSNLQIVVVR